MLYTETLDVYLMLLAVGYFLGRVRTGSGVGVRSMPEFQFHVFVVRSHDPDCQILRTMSQPVDREVILLLLWRCRFIEWS